MNRTDHRIVDCHTHLFAIDEIDGLMETMNGTELSAVCLLALVNPMSVWWAKPDMPEWYRPWFRLAVSVNVSSMLAKTRYPDRVFVFGGLDYNTPDVLAGHYNFAEQARTLIDMGVDGFKMWMGPYMRITTGLPLDSLEYDEYYSLLEEASLPILYHAGPRPELEGLLRKHPKLKIIFAHFFGGSRDLETLGNFFDAWPNTCTDLAPGGIFRGLSDNRDEAREFFIKYQDRILFGTDNSVRDVASVTRCQNKACFIRRFLESKSDLRLEELGMIKPDNLDPAINEDERRAAGERWADYGLYLDDGVLAKIYAENFCRMASPSPRSVNVAVALREAEKVLDRVRQQPDDADVDVASAYHLPGGTTVEKQMPSLKRAHIQELETVVAALQNMV
jgi:hypothetical protein